MSFGHPRSHYCIVGLWTVIMCVRSFDLSRTHVRDPFSEQTIRSRRFRSRRFRSIAHDSVDLTLLLHFWQILRDSVELNPINLDEFKIKPIKHKKLPDVHNPADLEDSAQLHANDNIQSILHHHQQSLKKQIPQHYTQVQPIKPKSILAAASGFMRI